MYQQITIIGNLARDPELRYLPNGDAVCNLSVAVNESRKNASGGYDKHTVWFRATAWGKQAETANEYLAKGRQVMIVGTLRSDDDGNPTVFTRKDGSSGASFEINVREIKFLGKKGDYDDSAPAQKPLITPNDDDDMPF